MRLSTSSSVILATLASSASLGQLAAAAPAEPGNSVGAPAPPVGLPGALGGIPATRRSVGADPASAPAPDLGSVLSLPVARRELEARQFGGVMDTVAGLMPGIVDKVFGMIGLQRSSTVGATEALPEALSNQIETLVKQVTSGGSSAPAASGRRDENDRQPSSSTVSGSEPTGPAGSSPGAPSPAPPAGGPTLPLSPGLPANPPNTPLTPQPAPPLFGAAGVNGTVSMAPNATSSMAPSATSFGNATTSGTATMVSSTLSPSSTSSA